jgi:undecaprenyl-diphosphatase
MTLLEAVALGLVQGLTEFFPVSSSGHLVLAEALLEVNPPGVLFEVLVHLATMLSVVVLYRRRLIQLLLGTLHGSREDSRYVGMLALASVPAALAGLALGDSVARLFDRPLLAALALLITGCVVYTIRWLAQLGQRSDPGWVGSLAVGTAQAVALIPGISRSGVTVAAALSFGTGRAAAAEFSFLLSVPAIFGASLLQLPQLAEGAEGIGVVQLIAAAVAAFTGGIAAIVLFVRWLRRGSFHRFAYYCWLVGGGYILYAVLVG